VVGAVHCEENVWGGALVKRGVETRDRLPLPPQLKCLPKLAGNAMGHHRIHVTVQQHERGQRRVLYCHVPDKIPGVPPFPTCYVVVVVAAAAAVVAVVVGRGGAPQSQER